MFFLSKASAFVYIFFSVSFVMLSRQLLALVFYIKRAKKLKQVHSVKEIGVTTLVTCASEKPEVFAVAMKMLREQKGLPKHAILVMMDAFDTPTDDDRECLRIARQYADEIFLTNARSKRENLAQLVNLARENKLLFESIAFMDSDTICDHDQVISMLCEELQDPTIGGVTTSQRALAPVSVVERISDWLEHARLLSSMAAGSLFGQVGCLPGRLYLARTEVVASSMDQLPLEQWTWWRFRAQFPFVELFKVNCKAGDDRWITNLILEKGFATTMVPEAGVTTSVPETYSKLFKTWKRWATSSQGYFYRTLHWAWRKPFVVYHYLTDILITHVTIYLIGRWIYTLVSTGLKGGALSAEIMLALGLVGMVGTFSMRQLPHLFVKPKDFLILPAFIAAVTIGQCIRFVAHYSWGAVGTWGTRRGLDEVKSATWVRKYERETPLKPAA